MSSKSDRTSDQWRAVQKTIDDTIATLDELAKANAEPQQEEEDGENQNTGPSDAHVAVLASLREEIAELEAVFVSALDIGGSTPGIASAALKRGGELPPDAGPTALWDRGSATSRFIESFMPDKEVQMTRLNELADAFIAQQLAADGHVGIAHELNGGYGFCNEKEDDLDGDGGRGDEEAIDFAARASRNAISRVSASSGESNPTLSSWAMEAHLLVCLERIVGLSFGGSTERIELARDGFALAAEAVKLKEEARRGGEAPLAEFADRVAGSTLLMLRARKDEMGQSGSSLYPWLSASPAVRGAFFHSHAVDLLQRAQSAQKRCGWLADIICPISDELLGPLVRLAKVGILDIDIKSTKADDPGAKILVEIQESERDEQNLSTEDKAISQLQRLLMKARGPDVIGSSVFYCPVTGARAQETPRSVNSDVTKNYPVLLKCGHVVSCRAMYSMTRSSRNSGNEVCSCPYCGKDTVVGDQHLPLYFNTVVV